MIKLRRIINNTIISFLGQAISLISTLLLTIAYGRFLGPFKFGELYFAIAFVSLIWNPFDSGYTKQIVRDVSQEPGLAPRYFSNIILIKLNLWLIAYILVLLVSWLLGYTSEVRVLVAICGFTLLSSSMASTFASLHYAFERTIFPAVGNILEKGLSALLGIFLLRSGAGIQVMAMVLVGGSLINVVWQAIWFFRLVGTSFVIDPALIRAIVRKNIPFFIYGVMQVGYTSIDTILLSLMTNSAVVGWFGAANRLFDTMNFLPTIVITAVIYPIFSKLSTTSDADMKLAVEKTVNFMLFCGVPITTVLIVAAPNIIEFLYGRSGFSPAVSALQALAPGVVFIYINFALGATLLSKKQDNRFPILAAISLVFNIGLNLVLIPLYQHIGAGIVSSLTEMLVCCICIVFIPPELRPFGSLQVAFKVFIASLVMALIILLLHTLSIFVILPIAMLVYLGAAGLLGTIPREDYQAVFISLRQKARLTSSANSNDLLITPLPSYQADELFAHELVTTMKLPTIRLQPVRRRPVKAIRLQPMRTYPPTQQGQIYPVCEECTNKNGGIVE